MKPDFLDRLSKNTQISYFTKILSVGTEIFQTNRQVEMAKLIVGFRKFANTPKKGGEQK
jgi:hypothetical protein